MTNSHKRGFALPTTIFALLVLAVLITGGFYMARQEAQIGAASDNAFMAFYVAEEGINQVVANWDPAAFSGLVLWGDTTLTGTLDQGAWTVAVTRMTDRLFFLESSGAVSRGGVLLSGARRQIGTAIRVNAAEINPPAALITRGSTDVRAGAEVDGFDHIPPGWNTFCTGPTENRAGILTDDITQIGSVAGGTVLGDPPVQEDTSIGDSTFTKFGDLLWEDFVDMATIRLSGGAINNTFPDSTADGVCLTGTSTNWGNPLDIDGACANYFPIIHSTGPVLTIQSGGMGQGILLVDGDLDLRGDFTFHGLVIVQGNFETQGTGNRVYGAVMASNADLDSQALVGGSTVTYSGCAVTRAVLNNQALIRPRSFPERSWMDLSSAVGQW